MSNQQYIGVRVPGGPKRQKFNWNPIIWIGLALLLAFNIFVLSGCTPTKQLRDSEPIGPYHILEGGTASIDTSYLVELGCNHFFVSQSFPVDTSGFDPFMPEIIDQLRRTVGWPCVCIYCNEVSTCY